jgi:hypothetical protein
MLKLNRMVFAGSFLALGALAVLVSELPRPPSVSFDGGKETVGPPRPLRWFYPRGTLAVTAATFTAWRSSGPAPARTAA